MKRFLLLLTLAFGVFACQSVPEGACVIEGKVAMAEYETMYLVDYSGNQLDSAARRGDGSFKFVYDSDSMPKVVVLEFRNPEVSSDVMYLPVALEPGTVQVEIGKYIGLSGTPLNDSIKKFFDEMQDLSDSFETEIATIDTKVKAFSAFYLKKMIENEDNVLGDYFKLAYARELLPADLAILLDRAK